MGQIPSSKKIQSIERQETIEQLNKPEGKEEKRKERLQERKKIKADLTCGIFTGKLATDDWSP